MVRELTTWRALAQSPRLGIAWVAWAQWLGGARFQLGMAGVTGVLQ